MNIDIGFSATNTFLPDQFREYFVGLPEKRPLADFYDGFEVTVRIEVSFKFAAFLSPGGWNYYFWVDSFLEEFRKAFEKETFLQTIGWEQALTILDFISPRLAHK